MTYQAPQDPFVTSSHLHIQPRRPRIWLVALLALLLAGGLIALGVLAPKLFDQAGKVSAQPVAEMSSQGKPTETQIECANIKHAYTNWYNGSGKLGRLRHLAAVAAEVELKMLTEQGKAFLDATGGYKDQPSKDLAVKIAQYNFDVGLVQLELKLSGQIKEETEKKAQASWREADNSYSAFLALTCL